MGMLLPKYHSDQLRVPGEPDGSPVQVDFRSRLYALPHE